MKKIFLLITLFACCLTCLSQGIKIFKTDGTTINIHSSELDRIEVYPDDSMGETLAPTFTAQNFTLAGVAPKRFDEKSGIITVELPFDLDRTALTARFDIAESSRVTVGGVEQQSDVTPNDFSMPVKYEVATADGQVFSYSVAVVFSDMPVLYVNTSGTPIDSKETYVENVDMLLLNSSNDAEYTSVKIKGRGNSSWNMPKKCYTLKLAKKDGFAGLKKHKTFALVANYSDKTLLRNKLVYQIGREIFTNMAWNPTAVNAHLILNGEYLGLYNITETAKIDPNRVNIPNMEDCIDAAEAGNYGFLLEVNARLDEVFNFTTSRGVKFSLKDPDGADISAELQQFISSTAKNAEKALYAADFTDPESDNFYRNFFDVASFIDWYLVNEITKNNDAIFYSSCYMYFDPADGKLHMGPLWDYDLACGNVNYNNCDQPTGFWVKDAKWISRMLADPDFVAEVKRRFNETREPLLNLVTTRFRAEASSLKTDVDMNFVRWPILGKYVWPNAAGYEDRTTYDSEISYMTDWLTTRLTWLSQNLSD